MDINLDPLGPYLLVIVAGLFVHACFSLSASMLMLINSHTIGANRRHETTLKLSAGYIAGNLATTLALVGAITYFFSGPVPIRMNPAAWIVITALLVLVGWIVLLCYYRRGKGTRLWLPRGLTERLMAYAKRTTTVAPSFGLGVTVIFIELPFLIAPLVLAGTVLASLPDLERNIGIAVYALAATLPLFALTALIGGGHKISTIQRWRESNKKFLQWSSGLTLILLGIYLFASNIWGAWV